MKRKEVILFMTVGTGVNSQSRDEGSKVLAQKLYSTINKIFPNHVVFFASEESKKTIPFIEHLFERMTMSLLKVKTIKSFPLRQSITSMHVLKYLNQKYGNMTIVKIGIVMKSLWTILPEQKRCLRQWPAAECFTIRS